jgi:hypothetical protein
VAIGHKGARRNAMNRVEEDGWLSHGGKKHKRKEDERKREKTVTMKEEKRGDHLSV